MIDKVDILHDCHCGYFPGHSSEKTAGLLCVVTHHQNHSHSDDYDYSPVLPGFELFQTGPDFDPAEEAFARRNRRKKKRKGRGL